MTVFSQTFTLTPSTGTGKFAAKNGLFYDPTGVSFIGRGINIGNTALPGAVSNAACQPLTTYFPNIGIIRLACDFQSYPSPASLSTSINRCTALGIVVGIEDHMWPQASPPTGSTQSNWYASMASYYKNDPFVWFMSTNEPLNPGIQANHTAIYNAVRGTGNDSVVLFDPIAGGGPNMQGPGALDASVYANMTNVGWDQHFYAWAVSYSSNQTTVNSGLATFIGQDKQMLSLDGVMPVLVGEWGDSTDGNSIDGDWQNIVTAVTTCGYGSCAWNYDNLGAGGDVLLNNGNLTAYGQLVSNYCAAGTRAKRS